MARNAVLTARPDRTRSRSPSAGKLASAIACCLAASAEAPGHGLPPGTTACDLPAWSNDPDPAGLNLRAAPHRSARILGRLPAPVRVRPESDVETPPGGLRRVPFRIVGHRDGWFLIEGARPPDRQTFVVPAGSPATCAGRGWVAAGMVRSSLDGGDTGGGLYRAPQAEADRLPARGADGALLGAEAVPRRLLACRGRWGLVESHDGVTGWWPRFCAAQITNCN